MKITTLIFLLLGICLLWADYPAGYFYAIFRGDTFCVYPVITDSITEASWFDYTSASMHTGYETAYESHFFFFYNPLTGNIGMVTQHNIDAGGTSDATCILYLDGLPSGCTLAMSDDAGEFSLSAYPQGNWHWWDNTDGGAFYIPRSEWQYTIRVTYGSTDPIRSFWFLSGDDGSDRIYLDTVYTGQEDTLVVGHGFLQLLTFIDEADFDSINIGDVDTFRYPICNSDETIDTLRFGEMDISHPEVFSVLHAPATLAPGECDDIIILFHPPDTGTYNDTLILHMNTPCDSVAYIPLKGKAIRPRVDSVWFSEETDCDGQNIVEICYNFYGAAESYFQINAQFSTDTSTGVWFDFADYTLDDDEGDMGDSVSPGIHCFNWIMSDDIPNIEMSNFAVDITLLGVLSYLADTNLLCNPGFEFGLDSCWTKHGVSSYSLCSPISHHGDSAYFVNTPNSGSYIYQSWPLVDAFGISYYFEFWVNVNSIDTIRSICVEVVRDWDPSTGYALNATSFSFVFTDTLDRLRVSAWDTSSYIDVDFATGEWYKLSVFADVPTKTQTIYLNDSAVATIISDTSYTGQWLIVGAVSGSSTNYGRIHFDDFLLTYLTDNPFEQHTIALGPVDSKPPEVSVVCPLDTIFYGDTLAFNWDISDMFPNAAEQCSMIVDYCDGADTFLLDDSLVWAPPLVQCDSAFVKIAAPDSFCNWGYDSCSFMIIAAGWLAVSFPETTVPPCETIDIPIVIDSMMIPFTSELELVISVNNRIIDPLSFVPDISPVPDSIGFINSEDRLFLILHWDTRVILSGDTLGYITASVDCDADGGEFSILDIDTVTADLVDVYYTDGIVIVDYTPQQWMQILRFDDIAEPLQRQSSLSFGNSDYASDNYDETNDLLYLPPPPDNVDVWFAMDDSGHPAVTRLERDIRDMNPINTWYAIVNEDENIYVHWNPSYFDEGVYMLNGVQDMRADTDYVAAPFETLTITWNLPDFSVDTMSVDAGWNLVSLPTHNPSDDPTTIFFGLFAGPYGYDPVSRAYFIATNIQPGIGYWVYYDENAQLPSVGVPVERCGTVVHSGWNLVGATANPVGTGEIGVVPTTSIFETFGYDPAAGSYFHADTLFPGKGYWMLINGNGVLWVPETE